MSDAFQKKMNETCTEVMQAVLDALRPFTPEDDTAKDTLIATAVAMLALARYYLDGVVMSYRPELLRLSLDIRRQAFPRISDEDGAGLPVGEEA